MARNKLIYGKCSIYQGVTSIATAPYGGNLLGWTEDGVNYDPNILIVADEISEQVSPDDYRDMGASPEVNINFLEWNVQMMKNLFNNGRVEDLGGGAYSINFPSDIVPGSPLTESNLLIVPEDTAQMTIYLPAAKVYKVPEEDIVLKLKEHSILPVTFKALIKKGVAVGHVGYENRQMQIALQANIRLIL